MSENGMPDLSRIVGLIMENPALIEQISGLLKNQSSEQEIKTEAAEEPVASAPTAEASASATYPRDGRKRSNRGRLLGSLKPYLSEKRASAIDTMISVADILDAMKGG